jgi:hypothetical protein
MEREMKESTRVPKMEWFDLEMVTIEQKTSPSAAKNIF